MWWFKIIFNITYRWYNLFIYWMQNTNRNRGRNIIYILASLKLHGRYNKYKLISIRSIYLYILRKILNGMHVKIQNNNNFILLFYKSPI